MAKTLYCLTRTVLSRGLMGLPALLCPCTAVATPISGLAITAIGPSVAVNGGVNTTASVRILDFQLFTQPVDEAPTWMFFGSCLILLGLTHAAKASKYPLPARLRRQSKF